jgi:hypothetical protein
MSSGLSFCGVFGNGTSKRPPGKFSSFSWCARCLDVEEEEKEEEEEGGGETRTEHNIK